MYSPVTQSLPTEKETVFAIVCLVETTTIDIIIRFCEESYAQRILLYVSNKFAENLATFKEK